MSTRRRQKEKKNSLRAVEVNTQQDQEVSGRSKGKASSGKHKRRISLGGGSSKSMHEIVAGALNDAQRSISCHNRVLTLFSNLFTKQGAEFLAVFLGMLDKALVVVTKEATVGRIVTLTVRLCTQTELLSDSQRDQVANGVLSHLLLRANAKDKAVRYRSCEIVGNILKTMGEDAEIDDDLFEKLTDVLLLRTKDSAPNVRVEAINGLARLQDTEDPDDAVVTEYKRAMETDSSKDARAKVIENIGLSRMTLPFIMDRLRDVSDPVRIKAFVVLKQKVPMQSLTIKQRESVVKYGLTDRTPAVQQAAFSLLVDSWLKAKKNNIHNLLKSLYIETFPEAGELLLKKMFSARVPSDTPLPPYKCDDLNSEKAMYWQVLLAHNTGNNAGKRAAAAAVEKYMPDTVELCEMIEAHMDSPFTVLQLLQLCKYVDLSDEAGRARLVELQKALLTNQDTSTMEFIEPSLHLLRRVFASEEGAFLDLVMGIIGELKDFVVAEHQAEHKEEEESSITREESGWLRLLTVVLNLAQHSRNSRSLQNPRITALLPDLVLPAFHLEFPECRQIAVQCLAVFGLADIQVARTYLPIILGAVGNDEGTVQIAAIQALFDLLMVFEGLLEKTGYEETPSPLPAAEDEKEVEGKQDSNDEQSEQGVTFKSVIDTFIGLLSEFRQHTLEEEDGIMQFKSVVTEGMCKLLMFDRIPPQPATVVLQSLFSFYFDPATNDEHALRQCLTVFFPTYTTVANGAKHARLILDAMLPTCDAIMKSDSGGKTTGVQFIKFVVYLLGLISTEDKQAMQRELILALCYGTTALAHTQLAKPLVSALAVTDVVSAFEEADGTEAMQQLAAVLDVTMDEVEDRVMSKQLRKIADSVAQWTAESKHHEELSEEVKSEFTDSVVATRVQAIRDDMLHTLEDNNKPTRAKRATRTAAKKKPATRKKAKKVEDDTDEEVEQKQEVKAQPKRRTTRRTAAKAVVKYVQESEESEEESESSSSSGSEDTESASESD